MKKKAKTQYFTKVHEDAIIQYVNSNSYKEREQLYIEYIQPAFNELVDKIVFTYKFINLPNIDDLKIECKVWLTTILEKFDKDKGSKAFSYFSVITKNWFIHKVKRINYVRSKEIQYNVLPRYIEEEYLSTENSYLADREKNEYWLAFWKEIEKWEDIPMKENEEKVYKAVKVLMKSSNDIEIFNKKAIYLYLRELTGLNTKQVVNSLKRLRDRYRNFKNEWDES